MPERLAEPCGVKSAEVLEDWNPGASGSSTAAMLGAGVVCAVRRWTGYARRHKDTTTALVRVRDWWGFTFKLYGPSRIKWGVLR
jgi:hypothetical protein